MEEEEEEEEEEGLYLRIETRKRVQADVPWVRNSDSEWTRPMAQNGHHP